MLNIQQIINEPISSNCYVIYDKDAGKDCIIVDPGSKCNNILFSFLEKERIEPKYIILTHEHFDHCWGVNNLVEKYNVPVVCSGLCAEAIKNEKKNCSVFYDINERFTINCKSVNVESLNYVMRLFDYKINFFVLPGHSNASICFSLGLNLFTGDTLIKDLRTVTKLPTGSVIKLRDSIGTLRSMQGQGYKVYPGHGDVFELDGYNLELMIKGELPK